MAVQSLRLEWNKDTVHIGLAKPGFITTPLTQKALDANEETFPDKKIFTDIQKKRLANTPNTAACFLAGY